MLFQSGLRNYLCRPWVLNVKCIKNAIPHGVHRREPTENQIKVSLVILPHLQSLLQLVIVQGSLHATITRGTILFCDTRRATTNVTDSCSHTLASARRYEDGAFALVVVPHVRYQRRVCLHLLSHKVPPCCIQGVVGTPGYIAAIRITGAVFEFKRGAVLQLGIQLAIGIHGALPTVNDTSNVCWTIHTL